MQNARTSWKWAMGLLGLSAVMAAVFLAFLPDTIPMHYNASWEVDRYGSKYEMLLFPGVALVLCVFFRFSQKLPAGNKKLPAFLEIFFLAPLEPPGAGLLSVGLVGLLWEKPPAGSREPVLERGRPALWRAADSYGILDAQSRAEFPGGPAHLLEYEKRCGVAKEPAVWRIRFCGVRLFGFGRIGFPLRPAASGLHGRGGSTGRHCEQRCFLSNLESLAKGAPGGIRLHR